MYFWCIVQHVLLKEINIANEHYKNFQLKSTKSSDPHQCIYYDCPFNFTCTFIVKRYY